MGRRNLIEWAIALLIGVAIDLPSALNRHHYVSKKPGVHVFAAVVAIAVLTLVARLLLFIVRSVRLRVTGTSAHSKPSPFG
jgi:hypothetical protein